jgi:hypothetical protein
MSIADTCNVGRELDRGGDLRPERAIMRRVSLYGQARRHGMRSTAPGKIATAIADIEDAAQKVMEQ